MNNLFIEDLRLSALRDFLDTKGYAMFYERNEGLIFIDIYSLENIEKHMQISVNYEKDFHLLEDKIYKIK